MKGGWGAKGGSMVFLGQGAAPAPPPLPRLDPLLPLPLPVQVVAQLYDFVNSSSAKASLSGECHCTII